MSPPSLSPLDHRAIEELQVAYSSRIETFRESASKWQAGLAALITGFSGLIVVTGRETFEKLNEEAQVYAGLWLGLAVVAAFVAGLLGLRASAGWPERFNLEKALDDAEQPGDIFIAINKWKQGIHEQARLTLKRSLWATGISIGLLFTSLAVTWYSPLEKHQESSACVVVKALDGTPIAEWKPDGSLEILAAGEGLILEACE